MHSTLLVDALGGSLIGVVDQQRWIREPKQDKKPRATRSYRNKESFKWEAAQERVLQRIVDMSRVIAVSDREADIYDYLGYMTGRELRFVQRGHARTAAWRRPTVACGRRWKAAR